MAQDATSQNSAPQQGATAPQSQQAGATIPGGTQQQGETTPQRQFIDLASI